MTYRIEFGPHIDWQRFKRFPKKEKERLRFMIEEKLATEPAVYGKPLRSILFGFWSLRVGAYRIVYRIIHDVVKIEVIGHRSNVYSEAEKYFAV
jgi:mRNA-degrading endonuclease RelE of RelBE toxin-antitoxin system